MSEIDASKLDSKYKPLRIWPVIVLLVAMVGLRFAPSLAEDESMLLMVVGILGPVVAGLAILVWWIAFSRATRSERLIGFLGAIAIAAIAMALSHKSMAGPGMIFATIPLGTAAFGIAAVLFGRVLSTKRALLVLLVATCGFGFSTLLATKGMWGHGSMDWYWRWEKTAEQNLLANRETLPKESMANVASTEVEQWLSDPQWSQFRGNQQASRQNGLQFSTDWSANPPEELWRVPVGPGWSSFVVAGNLLFTQEQLGDNETVVCYSAESGKEIWKQEIESRFYDPLGGPGPRATPTLAHGGLFVMGANGELQRLDPKTGEHIWTADIREVADREPPAWGFSSSPLVTDDCVIVHAGGADEKGTLAFDIETGNLKWSTAAGDHSYSSPQSWSYEGKQYVLMLTNTGLNVLDAQSGESQLDYDWPYGGYRVLQPQIFDGNCVLLATQEMGTRLIRLVPSDSGFSAEEVWTCQQFKPDFNDFVIHEGHLYGFDGKIFASVDLKTGKRNWKGGRYGKGQVLLLANSGALLIITEKGEAVVIPTDPTGHRELTKLQVLHARTWNHPVVVNDRLYVRNSEEAACYRLPIASTE